MLIWILNCGNMCNDLDVSQVCIIVANLLDGIKAQSFNNTMYLNSVVKLFGFYLECAGYNREAVIFGEMAKQDQMDIVLLISESPLWWKVGSYPSGCFFQVHIKLSDS